MNERIIKRRIKTVRRLLNKKKIGCLILTKPANVTYTTGFSGDDSWAAVTGRGVYLLTDNRYVEQAQNLRPQCRIIQRTGPIPEAAAKLVRKLKSVQTVTVEKSTSIADFEVLKKNVKSWLKTAANIIETLRSSKDAGEIAAVRAAARIAGQALRQTLQYMKPAITENELAGRLDFQIRKFGAVNSFETIPAFGANASRPHHQPGGRKLKKNDCLLVDFGVTERHTPSSIAHQGEGASASGMVRPQQDHGVADLDPRQRGHRQTSGMDVTGVRADGADGRSRRCVIG